MENNNVKKHKILNEVYDLTVRYSEFEAKYKEGKISKYEFDCITEMYNLCYDALSELNKSYKNEK